MTNRARDRSTAALLTLGLLLAQGHPAIAKAAAKATTPRPPSPLVATLGAELDRAMVALAKEPEPPYFLSYTVFETRRSNISTSFGAVTDVDQRHNRMLVIDLRVGSYDLDNTHPVRGDRATGDGGGFAAVTLPVEDDAAAIAAIAWRETDRRYQRAVEALSRARANRDVKVEEEDQSADLSRETPVVLSEPPLDLAPLSESWAPRLRALSALFAADPLVLEGDATIDTQLIRRTIVNSEGTRLETTDTSARLALGASTRANDGMELPRYESFFAFSADDLPAQAVLVAAAERMLADLAALRDAPTMDPYTGPAILTGRSAGVFFHEIFGHRIEGHRQRDESEGQTFKKLMGESVLPEFLSVTFDPTQKQIAGSFAAGYYRFDDEGIAARPVPLVENGILRAFLMSRRPVEGFAKSNGHGRAQPGLMPVGRQSNLVVSASKALSEPELRARLVEEAKAQGKSFGLILADIAGGFTFTGRSTPNAFAVQPLVVYKVFVDGRPDELVRGADLIGTPLTAFSKIVAASDAVATFNGVCGAESGWVPVSASSPSLLISQIEVQKKEKSPERPPLLPAPPMVPGSKP